MPTLHEEFLASIGNYSRPSDVPEKEGHYFGIGSLATFMTATVMGTAHIFGILPNYSTETKLSASSHIDAALAHLVATDFEQVGTALAEVDGNYSIYKSVKITGFGKELNGTIPATQHSAKVSDLLVEIKTMRDGSKPVNYKKGTDPVTGEPVLVAIINWEEVAFDKVALDQYALADNEDASNKSPNGPIELDNPAPTKILDGGGSVASGAIEGLCKIPRNPFKNNLCKTVEEMLDNPEEMNSQVMNEARIAALKRAGDCIPAAKERLEEAIAIPVKNDIQKDLDWSMEEMKSVRVKFIGEPDPTKSTIDQLEENGLVYQVVDEDEADRLDELQGSCDVSNAQITDLTGSNNGVAQ